METRYFHRVMNEVLSIVHAVTISYARSNVHDSAITLFETRVKYFIMVDLRERAAWLQ
jgi:hypothetical protein